MIVSAGASAQASTTTLVPNAYATTHGLDGGGNVATTIDILDESGGAIDSSKNIWFGGYNAQTYYTGTQNFTLPTSISPNSVTGLQVAVNYIGPTTSIQTWNWAIYNWSTNAWVSIGSNASDTAGWAQWTTFNFTVTGTLANYVRSSDGLIQLQLSSNNANDNCQIDYEAIVVTYGSSGPPPAPTGLSASSGNSQVGLSWTASSGATSYNVYRGTTAGGESATPVATGLTGTTYTNMGLTNGTTYYFKVAAVNSSGTSGMSNEASATPQVSIPPAPTGLSATAGNAQAGLTWSASSGATAYNIYRGTSAGGESSTPVATGVTGTTYTNTGLTNGTTYYFKVAAVNSAGTSGMSNEASVTPASGVPPSPTGLSATGGNAQNSLSWTTSSGATSYNIYRGTSAGGEAAAPVATGVSSTSYTDAGLTNGTTYYYKVAALNSAGTSGMSNEASATPQAPIPPAPSSLSATPGNGQVSLSWSPSSGAISYNVYRGTSSGGESSTPVATGITSTSYTNTGLTNGTAYYFKVAAVNSAGTSPMSSEASATPATSGFSNESAWDDGTNFFYEASYTGSYAHFDVMIDSDLNPSTGYPVNGIGADYLIEDKGFYSNVSNAWKWSSISTTVTETFPQSGTVEFEVPLSAFGSPKQAKIAFQGTDASWNPTLDPTVVLYQSSSSVPPQAPGNLTSTPGSGQNGLQWSVAKGATSYNIYRSTSSGGEGTSPLYTGVTATSFIDTGLTNGTTYYYKVAGVNAAGTSGMSNEASGTPANGISYYVSPSGSDSNSGAIGSPWLTVQHAANVVGPGTTVYLRAGTYGQFDVNVSGSATGGYITFTNYPGEAAIVDGTGWVGQYEHGLVHIQDHSYIKIQGLEIRNATSNSLTFVPNGIYVRGYSVPMSNIQIVNCHIHDIKVTATNSSGQGNAHGISIEGNTTTAAAALMNVIVTGCELNSMVTGWSETFMTKGNVDGFTITNNLIHDNNNIGIDMAGGWGNSSNAAVDMARNGYCALNNVYNCSTKNNPVYNYYSSAGLYVDGGDNIIIERNLSHNNDIGIQVSSERPGCNSNYVTVRDNVVYWSNNQGLGMGGYNQTATGGTTNCAFVNNTFYQDDVHPSGHGELWAAWYCQNNLYENNVTYAGPQGLFVNFQVPDTAHNGAVCDYNLYYDATITDPGSFWAGVGGQAYQGFTNSWQAVGHYDPHSHWSDPLFVSTSTPNFNLNSGSPALNTGTMSLGNTQFDPTWSTTNTLPTGPVIGGLDYAGNARTKNGTIDLGAYEN
jgi:fibronectin type 3 domain-containing protein